MSDQPDKPEDGGSASGESAVPEPELLKADDVHLSDPDVSADAVEPTLNTSADEVHLTEPSLGVAEISGDAAEAASLDEAAAEAESVAREAENVGTLVAGPRPAEDPGEAGTPTGTAPAGGKAGDVTDHPEEDVTRADEAVSSHEQDPPAGFASFAASGDEPGWTGTAEDQSRWEALFEEGEAIASRTPGDSAGATQGEADPRNEVNPGDDDHARAELPDGIPPLPATAPESSEDDGAGQGQDAHEGDEQAPGEEGSEPAASGGTAPPAAPWAQPFPGPHPQAPGSPVPPVGGPYGLPPAGANDEAPTRIRARSVGSSRGSGRKKLIILGVVGLVVLALLIFAIMTIVNALRSDDSSLGSSVGTTPGADGIIAENISPLELEAGACILGFDPADLIADVTTVTCATPHNAQLLATTSFPEDADFPGEAALNASGDDLCNSVPIDENAAGEYSGLTLTQVTPTTGTWAEGDRRIDCFVVSDEGNVITDTLLAE